MARTSLHFFAVEFFAPQTGGRRDDKYSSDIPGLCGRLVSGCSLRNPAVLCLAHLVAVACLLTGCDQVPTVAPLPTDTWYRPIDDPAHEFYPLPPFLFSPVKSELVEEAAAAMGDGPLLQLSTSEAIRYSDDRLRTVRELRPFLIHGLYRSNRAFNVAIADRALWVDSFDEPDDLNPVRRQPLVLYMDEVPPDVYVTVGEARRAATVTARSKDVN